jgi:hypothetical protein
VLGSVSAKSVPDWQAMYQQNPLAEGTTEWPDSNFVPEIWFN